MSSKIRLSTTKAVKGANTAKLELTMPEKQMQKAADITKTW